jgi:C_GCAxxG_C_C family probable redox protein
MVDYEALKEKTQKLAERDWDLPAIQTRYKTLLATGFGKKALSHEDLVDKKQQILERVQNRAEEYNLLLRNCARSTALALLEEFGLGNIEVVKALSPFPGFASSGWMCGGVTGGLVAIGLYGGSNDLMDQDAVRITMQAGKQFMTRFESAVGAFTCPALQEEVVFGRYMDPGAGPENMQNFEKAQGFEKCSLLPGIGARIAAEIIIDSLSAPSQ